MAPLQRPTAAEVFLKALRVAGSSLALAGWALWRMLTCLLHAEIRFANWVVSPEMSPSRGQQPAHDREVEAATKLLVGQMRIPCLPEGSVPVQIQSPCFSQHPKTRFWKRAVLPRPLVFRCNATTGNTSKLTSRLPTLKGPSLPKPGANRRFSR